MLLRVRRKVNFIIIRWAAVVLNPDDVTLAPSPDRWDCSKRVFRIKFRHNRCFLANMYENMVGPVRMPTMSVIYSDLSRRVYLPRTTRAASTTARREKITRVKSKSHFEKKLFHSRLLGEMGARSWIASSDSRRACIINTSSSFFNTPRVCVE